jgi:hypothetical protein
MLDASDPLCSFQGPSHMTIQYAQKPGWWHNRAGETPGSIPNPEVKPRFADGTALETGWESRALPARILLCLWSGLAHYE